MGDVWPQGQNLKKKIYFLSGALVALLFIGVEPFVQFWLGHHLKQFCEIILYFGPVVQEKLSLKDIIYLKL